MIGDNTEGIAALRAEVAALREEFTGRATSMESTITNVATTIETHGSQIITNTGVISSFEQRVSDVETAQVANTDRLTATETVLSDNSDAIRTQGEHLDGAASMVAENQAFSTAADATLGAVVDELSSSVNASVSDLQSTLDAQSGVISSTEERVTAAETVLSDNGDVIRTQGEQLESLIGTAGVQHGC